MSPSVRRILDEMFHDAYTAKDDYEAMGAVVAAIVRLGAVTEVDTAEIVRVLADQYTKLSRQADKDESEAQEAVS